ncbi:DciA family protein [Streptomyces sp. SAJ15]|uniref:DciA family protein n=1 Tax=Streptomyces sp. SAJ15 TaxID=2011095 RepID=UPI0016432BE3|nr:DciA family protein [Streptomyces sp. SAJ15]
MQRSFEEPNDVPQGHGVQPRVDLARVALRAAREGARHRARQGQSADRRSRRFRGRRQNRNEPVTFRTALLKLFEQAGVPIFDDHVLAQWDTIFPELARGLALVGFDAESGAVVLRPASSAWVTQARLLGPRLVERINERLGTHTVRSIRLLKPGAVEPSAQAGVPETSVNRRTAGARDLSGPTILAAIERQARQTPREPTQLFVAGRAERAYRHERSEQRMASTVHARALFRARIQREPSA